MVRAANDVKNESWSNEGSEEAQAGAVRGSAWGMMSRVFLSSGKLSFNRANEHTDVGVNVLWLPGFPGRSQSLHFPFYSRGISPALPFSNLLPSPDRQSSGKAWKRSVRGGGQCLKDLGGVRGCIIDG